MSLARERNEHLSICLFCARSAASATQTCCWPHWPDESSATDIPAWIVCLTLLFPYCCLPWLFYVLVAQAWTSTFASSARDSAWAAAAAASPASARRTAFRRRTPLSGSNKSSRVSCSRSTRRRSTKRRGRWRRSESAAIDAAIGSYLRVRLCVCVCAHTLL